ncbi:hypothetical protein HDU98_002630 [Podochytrium sp. JEL0797]|nr:hypothetical protein HDU98_002630 [Podochytrium sp. JEL0797]
MLSPNHFALLLVLASQAASQAPVPQCFPTTYDPKGPYSTGSQVTLGFKNYQVEGSPPAWVNLGSCQITSSACFPDWASVSFIVGDVVGYNGVNFQVSSTSAWTSLGSCTIGPFVCYSSVWQATGSFPPGSRVTYQGFNFLVNAQSQWVAVGPCTPSSGPPPRTTTAITTTARATTARTTTARTTAAPSPTCNAATASTRQEWRDLTSAQKQAFINAITRLRSTPSQSGQRSRYDDFTALHVQFISQIHGTPAFLPWHRLFIRNFEIALQQIDPSVTLPYWDWGYDGQNPLGNTAMFSSSSLAFGTERAGTGPQCVVDGFDANWTDNDGACLTRGYAARFTVPDNSQIAPIVASSPSYDQMRPALEGLHNQVHNAIGGDVVGGRAGDMSFIARSPNDPLFYMHHANVDRIWYLWQQHNPSLASQYSASASVSDILPGLGAPVSSALLSNGRPSFCIQYSTPLFDRQISARDNAVYDSVQHGLYVAVPVGSGKYSQTVARSPCSEISQAWIDANAAALGMDAHHMTASVQNTQTAITNIASQFDQEMDKLFAAKKSISYLEAYNSVIGNWQWKSI